MALLGRRSLPLLPSSRAAARPSCTLLCEAPRRRTSSSVSLIEASYRTTPVRRFASSSTQPLSATTASPIELDPAAPVDDAVRRIIASCMAQYHSNVPGILAGASECVHQGRVGVRRSRSALRLIAKASQPGVMLHSAQSCQVLQDELKWLGSALGNVRDLDVFLEETLPPVAQAYTSAQHGMYAVSAERGDATPDVSVREGRLQALTDEARRQRADAFKESIRALQSDRYHRLMASLEEWLSNPVMAAPASLSARRFGAREISRANRRLLDITDDTGVLTMNLTTMNPMERHEVRIRAKRLRYTIEFFSSLLVSPRESADAMKTYIAELKKLQSALGVANDHAVAANMILTDQLPCEFPLAAFILSYVQAHTQHNSMVAQQQIELLAEAPQFWKRRGARRAVSLGSGYRTREGMPIGSDDTPGVSLQI